MPHEGKAASRPVSRLDKKVEVERRRQRGGGGEEEKAEKERRECVASPPR